MTAHGSQRGPAHLLERERHVVEHRGGVDVLTVDVGVGEVQGLELPTLLSDVATLHATISDVSPAAAPQTATLDVTLSVDHLADPSESLSAVVDLSLVTVTLDSGRTWSASVAVDLGMIAVAHDGDGEGYTPVDPDPGDPEPVVPGPGPQPGSPATPGPPDGPDVDFSPPGSVGPGGLLGSRYLDGWWGPRVDVGTIYVAPGTTHLTVTIPFFAMNVSREPIWSMGATSAHHSPSGVVDTAFTSGGPLPGNPAVFGGEITAMFSWGFLTSLATGGDGDFLIAITDNARPQYVMGIAGEIRILEVIDSELSGPSAPDVVPEAPTEVPVVNVPVLDEPMAEAPVADDGGAELVESAVVGPDYLEELLEPEHLDEDPPAPEYVEEVPPPPSADDDDQPVLCSHLTGAPAPA